MLWSASGPRLFYLSKGQHSMSIAELLQTVPAKRPTQCKAGEIIAALPAEDREAITAALETHSAAVLTRILRLEGYDIGATTIKAHKAGECACVVDR